MNQLTVQEMQQIVKNINEGVRKAQKLSDERKTLESWIYEFLLWDEETEEQWLMKNFSINSIYQLKIEQFEKAYELLRQELHPVIN